MSEDTVVEIVAEVDTGSQVSRELEDGRQSISEHEAPGSGVENNRIRLMTESTKPPGSVFVDSIMSTRELEDGRQSISEHEAPGSGVENNNNRIRLMTESTKPFWETLKKRLLIVTKFISSTAKIYRPKGPRESSIFLMLGMSSMLYEPIFLYAPAIRNDENCFLLNNWWFFAAPLFLNDIMYSIYAISEVLNDSLPKSVRKRLLFFKTN